jgi:hypothetical protein
MKNIHLISTDKPSRLHEFGGTWFSYKEPSKSFRNYKMYITNDEEIKEGDYMFDVSEMTVYECIGQGVSGYKIILTTDQDLIKYGVQPIDDEFLKWFVKNPSCEEVEVRKYHQRGDVSFKDRYRIIIPIEEPKQEIDMSKYISGIDPYDTQDTLEEAAYNYENSFKESDGTESVDFIEGAKWQAERIYNEADRIMKFLDTEKELKLSDAKTIERIKWYFETYFEQFKKK